MILTGDSKLYYHVVRVSQSSLQYTDEAYIFIYDLYKHNYV